MNDEQIIHNKQITYKITEPDTNIDQSKTNKTLNKMTPNRTAFLQSIGHLAVTANEKVFARQMIIVH